MFTRTPGINAPDGSMTVPESVPVGLCAGGAVTASAAGLAVATTATDRGAGRCVTPGVATAAAAAGIGVVETDSAT